MYPLEHNLAVAEEAPKNVKPEAPNAMSVLASSPKVMRVWASVA
jgi:hypothetical protein